MIDVEVHPLKLQTSFTCCSEQSKAKMSLTISSAIHEFFNLVQFLRASLD